MAKVRDMKSYTIYFITILIFGFLVGCEKDEDTEGQRRVLEYFECKIDGESFQAVNNFFCNGIIFNYYPESYLSVPQGYGLFGGRNCNTYDRLVMITHGLKPETGFLSFTQPAFADSVTPYYQYTDFVDSTTVLFDQLVDGQMKIEHFIPRESTEPNTPLGSVQGTFEFRLTNETRADTIRVTDGRFRLDVIQIF